MDIGHTYDIKAQTKWTYKLQCTYELRCKLRQTNSQRKVDQFRHCSLLKHKLFHSFLNFDKQTQTHTQRKTYQLFKQT
jgi:hypothetical protein